MKLILTSLPSPPPFLFQFGRHLVVVSSSVVVIHMGTVHYIYQIPITNTDLVYSTLPHFVTLLNTAYNGHKMILTCGDVECITVIS